LRLYRLARFFLQPREFATQTRGLSATANYGRRSDQQPEQGSEDENRQHDDYQRYICDDSLVEEYDVDRDRVLAL